ncbi:hypothetical protein [Ovoidimarina sediminis]|nr:hypothetical protein [Rhodophyticola sp. MJ-SS7]MDU8943453.1 hypothetical protein [Rhodophyticola sp. MJ-SS7]
MQIYATCTKTDTRSIARREIYRRALIEERRANAGFFGRLMLAVGI